MKNIKQHVDYYRNNCWNILTSRLPDEQDDLKSKFKRGNLVLRNNKVKQSLSNYHWQIEESKSLLILAKVNTDRNPCYLVKFSKSSAPTLNSSHAMTLITIDKVDKYFKLSIATAFKDL